MPLLFHGTILRRAESIIAKGPDPNFVEPGARERAECFCTCVAFGPFPLGEPEMYACYKSRIKNFRDEGGPAIVMVDIPDEIVKLAVDEEFLPISQGIVDFREGPVLVARCNVWLKLKRRIIPLNCP